ncbi:hypothetical protein EW145_g304 [Phellinidium pouzarii]|uniref:Inositol-pentakisphosphate 2-kinase n=1 Tax=Phellinidium pouzarii TaxID=167371 RepID=A0A4S4LJJ5_9AGAM|nr:hypothetical protein EW145_g304 [Phellinidium pouzarii]
MDPTVASASVTSPSDWRYVSEGGSTIVLSYSGPPHPIFSGTVLRLRKIAIQHSAPEGSNDSNENNEPDDPSIAFQLKVISKLIPPIHLPRLVTVRVDRSWLETLRSLIESVRPSERRSKDTVDVRRHKAVLATDLVGGEGWTVEIKPKWGFLPNLAHTSAETSFIKSQRCRFCMHSHYRTLRGENASHEYCPLDLYSGNAERTAHALRCLWKDWVRSEGRLNNLKLFARGKLVDSNDRKMKSPPPSDEREDKLIEYVVAALLPLLLGTPVLRSVARLQRMLDPLDIEGLFSLYDTYRATRNDDIPPLEKLFPDPTLDEWVDFVGSYRPLDSLATLDRLESEHARLHFYTMAYLLSATFKDCSLMLQLERGEGKYDTITVIDLDPKSMSRLKRWAELDHDIATAYPKDDVRCCRDDTT